MKRTFLLLCAISALSATSCAVSRPYHESVKIHSAGIMLQVDSLDIQTTNGIYSPLKPSKHDK